jgi:hypothetical protein
MPDGKHLIPALEQQLETGIFIYFDPLFTKHQKHGKAKVSKVR